MKNHIAPLKNSFMVISMFGFVISAIYIVPKSLQFGFAFCLVFLVMFIASVISMTYSEEIEHLQIDYKRKGKEHVSILSKK